MIWSKWLKILFLIPLAPLAGAVYRIFPFSFSRNRDLDLDGELPAQGLRNALQRRHGGICRTALDFGNVRLADATARKEALWN